MEIRLMRELRRGDNAASTLTHRYVYMRGWLFAAGDRSISTFEVGETHYV